MLTILCTISLFLFQAANATFQPVNRIDPNAPDQQKSIDVFTWNTPTGWIVIAAFLAVAAGLGYLYVRNRKTPTDAVHRG